MQLNFDLYLRKMLAFQSMLYNKLNETSPESSILRPTKTKFIQNTPTAKDLLCSRQHLPLLSAVIKRESLSSLCLPKSLIQEFNTINVNF